MANKNMSERCKILRPEDVETMDDYRAVINNMLCKYSDELHKKGNFAGLEVIREVLRRQMEINRRAFVIKEEENARQNISDLR